MARDRRQRKGVAARRGSERLNRTEGSRQPRRTYVRFCEGKRTEPSYFEGIRRQLRRAAVDIRVRPQVGSPSRLVRHAVRADLDGVDEVWCLFDVEAPEPHGDLDEALRLAAGNPAIRLAVSNP
ncbi:MAG: RloB family protein, partial [Vicinamibacterales bacterium]